MTVRWRGRMTRPGIFSDVVGVAAAMTLRGDTNVDGTFGYNMSMSVGDDPERVKMRRRELAEHLGFQPDRLVLQTQVHESSVVEITRKHTTTKSDAMFTREQGWLLGISIADCVPVLLYDPVSGIVGGIHSGWRGTVANIVNSFANSVTERVGGLPRNFRCWVGPAAGPCCYEVGEEVAMQFDESRRHPIGARKYLLDNRGAVIDQLIRIGVPSSLIEVDMRCTICDTSLQSYRRDGASSGRMLAVIGLAPTHSGGR